MKKVRNGYLTVFFSLILTIMISLCLTLVAGARESTRRLAIECVTAAGLNSILAEFHRELLEQYELFFLDTSYGSAYADYEKTAAHLKDYLDCNLEGDALLKLQADSVEIAELSVATDTEGAVLRRQAVDVMRQNLGIAYLEEVAEWVNTADSYGLNERDILAEEQCLREELLEWDGEMIETEDGETQLNIDNPCESVISMWQAGILNLVLEDISTLSKEKADTALYTSKRQCLSGTGLNAVTGFQDNFYDELFFDEYILQYTGRYDAEKENGRLNYQTEYILAGKPSDVENLKSVAYSLLTIRAAANVLYLLSDAEKMGQLELQADIAALILLSPEAAQVLKMLMLLAWAVVEAVYDVSQLLKGNRVPLLKTKEDWHYSLEQMLGFQGKTEEGDKGHGLSYADYLRVLLCFQNKKQKTLRLMDIMEMDIRKTQGNACFRMDACADSLKAEILYRAKEGKTYSIIRACGY